LRVAAIAFVLEPWASLRPGMVHHARQAAPLCRASATGTWAWLGCVIGGKLLSKWENNRATFLHQNAGGGAVYSEVDIFGLM
jgi:hypothetical protein